MKKKSSDYSDYFDCFPFTHDQARRIEEILKRKFNTESVNKFIDEVRDCSEGAACLLDQPDFKTYKNDRKSMINLLEKSYTLLDVIRKGGGIRYLSSFSKLLDTKSEELEMECQELAVTIGNLLSILIRKLKKLDDSNEQRAKKRPKADSKGIISELIGRWEKSFNEYPSKYRYGPFADVARVILEGLNLPSKDPQRAIEAAFKSR